METSVLLTLSQHHDEPTAGKEVVDALEKLLDWVFDPRSFQV
jgi:hypothetical protein